MNKDVTKPFDRFWSILKPDSKDIRDIYLFAIVGGILSLGLPLGIQAIINFIQAGKVSTSWFVLVGWAIYPIGYIAGTEGGLFGMKVLEGLSMDIVYNIGDAINKIGFGLVIYSLAVSSAD